ncbi:DNA-directed RNA polymerase subunit omega [Alicyclobacillus sp. SO9]|uniref:DNA-directed RNA polymerase subunit omega n=1 Tax=Alicyclobacillus sp. SO9 TaxID=2665646 RepID=UPI0018E81135|nr:DNA-directed RNA polymerase subunit omega [Alicyclobacillus sp. SO9]QQE80733.1 DNA-directed RNA polymerase subunit omega [Alicyclobacillus sp. SO9]
MLYPSIDELVKLVDSKYTLVVTASKRARQLQEETMDQPGASATKNVSRALWEIYSGSITYVRTHEGIK